MAATDYDFIETRTQILNGALRKLGALGLGETVTGEEAVNAADNLNKMVKEWQTVDIFLWQLQVKTVVTSPNVATVAAPTDPAIIGIDKAAWVDGSNHTPIEVISWRDYQAIESKADIGDPQKITIDNARNPTLYQWPVPSIARTLRLVVVAKNKDWDSTTSTGDMPEHWALALEYGLAAILCDEYGVTGSRAQNIAGKAEYYLGRAKVSDRQTGDRTVVTGAY